MVGATTMIVVYTGYISRYYVFMLTILSRQHSLSRLPKQTRIECEGDLAGVVAWRLVDCATGGLSVQYTNLDLAAANRQSRVSLNSHSKFPEHV
jgi:hypothetical protein